MAERPAEFSIDIPLTEAMLTQSFGVFRQECLAQVYAACATYCGIAESALNVTRAEVRLKTLPLREFADVTLWLEWED